MGLSQNFLKLIQGTAPYLLWEGGRAAILRYLDAMRLCEVEAINRIGFLTRGYRVIPSWKSKLILASSKKICVFLFLLENRIVIPTANLFN